MFEQISHVNQTGRQVNWVEEDKKFLDAFAQIITGDEVCGAVAISGKDILIATNKGTHDRKSVSWSIKATLREKTLSGDAIRLSLTCCIGSADGTKIEKTVGPIDYRYNDLAQKAYLGSNPIVTFNFEEGEFAYLPGDVVTVSSKMNAELDAYDYFGFQHHPIGHEFEVCKPIVTSTGALKRRTAKLIHHLSLISHLVLRKRDYLPQFVKPQNRNYALYLTKKYGDYKQTTPNSSQEGFIETIRNDSKEKFKLDSGGDTTDTFLAVAREHYEVFESVEHINKHTRWVEILKDSLTYDLSRSDDFKEHICVHSKNSKGLIEMGTLYEELISDYVEYKKGHKLQTSTISVKSWFNQLSCKPSYPQFIRNNFQSFCSTARRYFVQLAYMEEYIKRDAERNGFLARRLKDENIFKDLDVYIVDGEEGVHAEMRLFSHHLSNNKKPSDYYGIAKLCCALCNYTFQQFKTEGRRIPETRGTFATLFRWPLPESLREDRHMKVFLGDDLFNRYNAFGQIRLESATKGPFRNGKEICRSIISMMDSINNSKPSLRKLGIDESLAIPLSSEHYAVNEQAPKLPSGDPAVKYEQIIDSLERQYIDAPHSSFFEPLKALGLVWKEKNDNHNALHYLERAAKIYDQLPTEIDLSEAGKVFHILGNIYTNLKQNDKASQCLEKAMEVKRLAFTSPHIEIAKTLNSLGNLQYIRQSPYEAEGFYHLAIAELAGANDDISLRNKIENNLAKLPQNTT